MEWEWKLTSNNRKHLPQTGKTLHLSGLKFHFLGHILLPIFMIIFPMFSLYNFQYLVAISNFKKTVSYNRKSMLSLILMIFWWLVLLFLEPLFSRLRKSTDFSSNFWENGIIFVSVQQNPSTWKSLHRKKPLSKSLLRKFPPSKMPPQKNTSQQNPTRQNNTQQNTYDFKKAYLQI